MPAKRAASSAKPAAKAAKAAKEGDAEIAASRKAESEAALFPPLEPYATGTLVVPTASGAEHRIYYEECGNADGMPVVIVHGGPGAGCNAKQRRFHDPKLHRIVLFDQRGCGRSTPDGCLEDNTTWDLVADMEANLETFRRTCNVYNAYA